MVSVIVPVHNGARYIGATLDSALQQTYRDLEVIVVDDGSSDGTRAVVEERAARDPRLRLIVQANGGVAAARNRALAAARGRFIAPLDADDVWEPTKIERQVRRMHEAGEETGLVYTWWVWIDPEGALLDASPRWRVEGYAGDALLQVNYTGNASVPLFRRRCLEQIGGYDETLRARGAEGCEDVDVALKVSERWRVAVEAAALVGYRRRPDGMSAAIDRMWRSYTLVLQSARQRRGESAGPAIRRAQDQFALYLAGVSFWSGEYGRAVGWGVRALRSPTAYAILPHVARGVVPALWNRRRDVRVVAAGVKFGEWPLPEPRIPYHRICARLLSGVRA
jgi:glycosyltransferase involved in cell wall biosynthesis